MKFRHFAAWCFILVGLSCRSATNQKYQGEPIATLNGRLTLSDNVTVKNPVRLALAWFPYGDPLPSAIITEDVSYQGQFPQNFTFNIYGLPPEKAQHDWGAAWDAGTGTLFFARGFLIAYEDLNGDGELSLSKGDEPVKDRILGTTWASVPGEIPYASRTSIEYDTAPETTEEHGSPFYLERSPFPTEHFEFPKNLPLDAGIEIALVDNARLGLYGCIDTWEGKTQADVVCGLELAVKPRPVELYGYAEGDHFDLHATWDFAFHKVPNQKGSLNGNPLKFGKIIDNDLLSDGDGLVAQGTVEDWLRPGINRVKLWSDDDARYPPQTLEFQVAGKFELISASQDHAGNLSISWTESEGAVQYSVRATQGDPNRADTYYELENTQGTAATFPPPEEKGPVAIDVIAYTSRPLTQTERDIPHFVDLYELPDVYVRRIVRKTINWP